MVQLKLSLSSYKIYWKYSQITRQFGTLFECRLISNIKKKYWRQKYKKPQNCHFDKTFIISRSYIKYCRRIKQLDCSPICTNGRGGNCCCKQKNKNKNKQKTFVQITRRETAFRPHLEKKKLSTSTHRKTYKNLQMYIVVLIVTCTLVRRYKILRDQVGKIN